MQLLPSILALVMAILLLRLSTYSLPLGREINDDIVLDRCAVVDVNAFERQACCAPQTVRPNIVFRNRRLIITSILLLCETVAAVLIRAVETIVLHFVLGETRNVGKRAVSLQYRRQPGPIRGPTQFLQVKICALDSCPRYSSRPFRKLFASGSR